MKFEFVNLRLHESAILTSLTFNIILGKTLCLLNYLLLLRVGRLPGTTSRRAQLNLSVFSSSY